MIKVKLNNKGRARRLIMLCILIVALLIGWLYMRHLASKGNMDPEIVKVIEDPVGTAKEYVDAFNHNTQKRMDSLKDYDE
jgi:hypothetical protein